MDEALNRVARDLSEAIRAAVANDSAVRACREQARAAGYEVRLSLEAVIGFASRAESRALVPLRAPSEPPAPKPLTISANDRRFLRSLRIAVDSVASESD